MYKVACLAAFLMLCGALPPTIYAQDTDERVIFNETCDREPVLSFWTGRKPAEHEVETVAADPAPFEGSGCTRVTMTWDEEQETGYSYWSVRTWPGIELLNGVNYRFRGAVYCPEGESISAKVRFRLPNAGREIIWHTPTIMMGEGWQEFVVENLREMALRLAPEDVDTDRIELQTLFFNIGGNPTVFAVDNLQVTMEGEPLPQLVRPPGTPFLLPVDFPLLRLHVDGPCAGLHVADPQNDSRPVFTAAPYTDAQSEGSHVFYVRLDGIPRQLVCTADEGPAGTVTGAAIIMPGGDVHELQRTADDPPTFSAPELTMPEQELPPITIGFYGGSYPVTAANALPSRAWRFVPNPAQVAEYDFSVLQTQGEGPNREFCEKILELNPEHKIILRLVPIMGVIPKYFFEPFYRAGFIAEYVRLIEQAGRENVYAVTIGEEENGNFMRGLWWTNEPPEWVDMYRQRFERETGNTLTWKNAVCGNEDYLEWLKPKIRFFYNDVYDQLKAHYPDLPVLQYKSLKGTGSEIAWHEAGEIKADGWVAWNFRQRMEPVLVESEVPGVEGGAPVWMWRDASFIWMQQLRSSGLDNDMIYHCGFAHQAEGEFYEAVEQVKMLQDMGYRHSFLFYPVGGKLEPEHCLDPAFLHEIEEGDFKMWRDRRARVLEYLEELRQNR